MFIGLKLIDPNFKTNGTNTEESMMNYRIIKDLKLTDTTNKKKPQQKKCC